MFELRRAARAMALAGILAISVGTGVVAAEASFRGVAPEDAVAGFDAVELSEGNQVRGQGRYTYLFRGLQWRFANEANKQAFKANPDAYIE